MKKAIGPDWPIKAKDRTQWKGLVKTLAQNWAVEGAA